MFEDGILTRRQFIKASGVFGLSTLGGCRLFHAAKPRQKTNVLLIMADDMGFSDAGCYGGDVRTPVFGECEIFQDECRDLCRLVDRQQRQAAGILRRFA